jgi:hypothetical protein
MGIFPARNNDVGCGISPLDVSQIKVDLRVVDQITLAESVKNCRFNMRNFVADH